VGEYLGGGVKTDLRRNPFNDRVIASGSDDGKVFIWQVPQGFTLHTDADEPADVAPLSKLTGHSRYVLEPSA
jgi:coronin-1B/1C/6